MCFSNTWIIKNLSIKGHGRDYNLQQFHFSFLFKMYIIKFQESSRRREEKWIFIFKEHSAILDNNSKIQGVSKNLKNNLIYFKNNVNCIENKKW